ncbi:MAG: hypothetical protein KAJ19_21140 [Gammaproteobacteria bacterium]|nr:hypothetical protein [Gammaproteobacteria bacterium]
MKVKLDFITNSSSTAYLVYMPKNFNLSAYLPKLIKSCEYGDDLFEYYEDKEENEPEMLERITKNISKLQHGEELWHDDTICYNSTQHLVVQADLIVAAVDISGDIGGIIQPVNIERIDEIQKRYEENENQT